MAANAPGQLALASNHETAPAALLENLVGSQREMNFKHSQQAPR